jgi:formylglycine-generating enzyme required for sulfatase activity
VRFIRVTYPSHDANDPVVCVSWNDAEAYVAWISSKTGKEYCLPSAAEYEYVAAGGTSGTTFWFGSRASHNYMPTLEIDLIGRL